MKPSFLARAAGLAATMLLTAAPAGAQQPAYPDAVYVVTSVMGGQVDAIAAFRWDAGRRDFISVELPHE